MPRSPHRQNLDCLRLNGNRRIHVAVKHRRGEAGHETDGRGQRVRILERLGHVGQDIRSKHETGVVLVVRVLVTEESLRAEEPRVFDDRPLRVQHADDVALEGRAARVKRRIKHEVGELAETRSGAGVADDPVGLDELLLEDVGVSVDEEPHT
jgi:hypothetical protein